MAEAAKPQTNPAGEDCSSVGKKFQAIIYMARDEYMAKAKSQCVSEGRTWNDSREESSHATKTLVQRRDLADARGVLPVGGISFEGNFEDGDSVNSGAELDGAVDFDSTRKHVAARRQGA